MPESKMNSVGSLWRDSWRLYADRFAVMIEIVLVPVVFLALGNIFQAIGGFPILIVGSVFLAAGVLLSIIASAAIINSFHHATGFEESYRVGGRLFWRLVWVAILTGLASFGGFVMLVIPGIWLAIALIFSNYALVLEGKYGLAALVQSREYVKGYWWAIFGRLLLLCVGYGAVYLVIGVPFSLVGGAVGSAIASAIITLFIIPFSIAYYYTMYRNLVALKPHVHDGAPVGKKTFLIVAQVVGLAAVFIALVGFILAVTLGGLGDQVRLHGNGGFYGNYGYGNSPTSSVVTITSVNPASGPVGKSVTIYGTSFGAANTVELDGFTAAALENIPSADGTKLTFTIPATIGPYCPPGSICQDILEQVIPGVYQVSVMERDGVTNAVPFTVTAK